MMSHLKVTQRNDSSLFTAVSPVHHTGEWPRLKLTKNPNLQYLNPNPVMS